MVIKVGEKWCQATKTWKFWWNFLAKSLFLSRYPSFSPFERPDAYKCYTFSESYGSRETRDIKSSTSKFDIEAGGILSSLWTQTGPWSDTASYPLGKNGPWMILTVITGDPHSNWLLLEVAWSPISIEWCGCDVSVGTNMRALSRELSFFLNNARGTTGQG